ncbi:hypothetical protein [Pedobacter steynii]|uniref:LTXXQ motif family protein n=1 Tax=Pedobacter steynii TaxID=430522 RepID=A0A1D7QI21_9SPHI|nr:hypothetical protein [Pedobacter steynii]AOM78326.1 hypothetical protein BFS30_14770 [Pedobacter steynii]
MKKLLMICGLLFSVITFAQAQQDGGRKMRTPEERAQKNAEGLTKRLGLNDDQKAKATAIFLEQANAVNKAREAGSDDKEARRAQMKQLNEDTDAKINALLTEDQKKTYETWKAERKDKMKRGGRGDGQKSDGNR